MEGALLDVRAVSAGYGGVPVVRDVDLSVRAGEVLALLGPNGAGKTTFLLTVAGMLTPLAGTVEVFGRPTARRAPDALARDGLALVPDDRALFGELTTEENLDVVRRRGASTTDEILDLFPALLVRRHIRAALLSGGEQQMLALGRALINRPKLLLVDEMSMGLAPEIVRSLLPVIRNAATEGGAGIVLVEQHVSLALSIADEAVVMVRGTRSLCTPAAELRANPTMLENAYLGTMPT
jgi:branched-chain amino acid transport system ATP-binding protein